jgi:cytochrome c biogenesis protein CcmG/thiol:disulfide interchange protein DsbE
MKIRPPSAGISALAVLVVLAAAAVAISRSSASHPSRAGLASNPALDPGTVLSGPAPGFALTDQFGRRVSLHSFRGRVVILAFNDAKCTTVCPLTTTAMVDAQQMLGAAGARVQLLAIDANPNAIAIGHVRVYSRAHGMLHKWHFLTAPLPQLKRVWKAYHIEVQIVRGQIDHTPALFVISPAGMLEKVYLTQMSYAGVHQLGQLLAQESSALLPGNPRLRARLSYAQIPAVSPRATVSLPRAGGGTARLGPGRGPRLEAFFATWVSGTYNLRAQLEMLDRYQAAAAARRLPGVTAVDEAGVEPSAQALTNFLRALHDPLSYPVAIDQSGRVADGYQVQDEPWFVLTSSSGRILWYYDASTQGPLTLAALTRNVRAALSTSPPASASSPDAAAGDLAGAPGQLTAVHAQAGRLLASEGALAARIHALRGYPVVINAWASWCTPCLAEFPLFASAAARYGHEVAFLGVDTDDSAADARSFLAKHRVGYPSYQSTSSQLSALAAIPGLPTTIFVNRAGKVVSVHVGQYDVQGTLDGDIQSYALPRP